MRNKTNAIENVWVVSRGNSFISLRPAEATAGWVGREGGGKRRWRIFGDHSSNDDGDGWGRPRVWKKAKENEKCEWERNQI